MSLHDVHSCSMIFSENLELKKKLAYVRKKQDKIQKELDCLLKKSVESCPAPVLKVHVAVQTELKPGSVCQQKQISKSKETTQGDLAQINKILEMHAQLLKRYDKEVKLNMTYADTVSELHGRLIDTERQLREERDKKLLLEGELNRLRENMKKSKVEDPVFRDVVTEKIGLAKENKKLKEELKGLDENFFEELEDLKYALQQSTRLNVEYEKALKQLCSQQGIKFHNLKKFIRT